MCLKEKRALDRALKQRTKRGAARGMGSFFLVFFSMEALVPWVKGNTQKRFNAPKMIMIRFRFKLYKSFVKVASVTQTQTANFFVPKTGVWRDFDLPTNFPGLARFFGPRKILLDCQKVEMVYPCEGTEMMVFPTSRISWMELRCGCFQK